MLNLLGSLQRVRLGQAEVLRGLLLFVAGLKVFVHKRRNTPYGKGEKLEDKPQGALRGPPALEGEPIMSGSLVPSLRLGGGCWSYNLPALDHNPASSNGSQLLVSYIS